MVNGAKLLGVQAIVHLGHHISTDAAWIGCPMGIWYVRVNRPVLF